MTQRVTSLSPTLRIGAEMPWGVSRKRAVPPRSELSTELPFRRFGARTATERKLEMAEEALRDISTGRILDVGLDDPSDAQTFQQRATKALRDIGAIPR